MKPYRTIPIDECGEPLLPIPASLFGFFDPPPYMAFGAPYGSTSPWMLRKSVLQALVKAQENLVSLRPGWKIMIFDAYRPNDVQAYMVEREFVLQAAAAGIDANRLTKQDREKLAPKVFRIWGIPSMDPKTPPPHSTGAVIDCTLMDAHGREVDMGSPIDENSDRSNPDYFVTLNPEVHTFRNLLHEIMQSAGFVRISDEWWHFSQGDQYWAWRQRQDNPESKTVARFGRADLL